MKCPECNFLNSNTRTQCLKCNADLSELHSQSELLRVVATQHLIRPEQTKQGPIISIPAFGIKIPKKSTDEEIRQLKELIEEIKKETCESNVQISSNETISESRASNSETDEAFEETYAENTTNPEDLIQIPASLARNSSSTNSNLSLVEKVAQKKEELTELKKKWKRIYSLDLDALYSELLDSYPRCDSEAEFELNPIINQTNQTIKETDALYHLLMLEAQNNPRDFSKPLGFVTSDTRTIDRNSLHNTLTILRPKLMKEIENQEKSNFSELLNDELPEANNINIIIATLIDISFLALFVISFFYIGSDYSLANLPSVLVDDPLQIFHSQMVRFSPFAYLFTYCLSVIFFAASPGQVLSGIALCSIEGKKSSINQRCKRIIFLLLNILTLGIRPIYLLSKRNGLTCRFSKTKLTYSAFVNS